MGSYKQKEKENIPCQSKISPSKPKLKLPRNTS